MNVLMKLPKTVVSGGHILLQNLSVGSKLSLRVLLEIQLHLFHSLGNVLISYGEQKRKLNESTSDKNLKLINRDSMAEHTSSLCQTPKADQFFIQIWIKKKTYKPSSAQISPPETVTQFLTKRKNKMEIRKIS